MRVRFLFVTAIATIVGFLPNVTGAIEFFAEDFESYTLDGDVTTAGVPTYGGTWTISNTATTVETEAQFRLVDTKSTATLFMLPSQFNLGPATIGGSTTPLWDVTGSAPGGLFMMSIAGGLPPSAFASFPAGTTPADPDLPSNDAWNSRINNGTYTGASNDIITPSFSTVGATDDVWLHTSVSALLNDNGQAIFDVDVSTDGGSTWVNKYRRIAPGNGRNTASGDFDGDLDVDGKDFLSQQRLFDDSDCALCGPDGGPNEDDHDTDTNRRNSDQRFSDWSKAYQGAYTPVVATTGATLGDGNAGATVGELSLKLGSLAEIGGEADVKVRFRQFESRDDDFIAIDNIKINEAAPAGSESFEIFSEDFNTQTLGAMDVYTMPSHPFSVFAPGDSGGGSGTTSGFSWGAEDRASIDPDGAGPLQPEYPTGRYTAGSVGAKGVNHLGHPTPEGDGTTFPLNSVPFAILDSKAEEDDTGSPNNTQAERLHTPILDLSGQTTVILEWDDESIVGLLPDFSSIMSVVLMEDDDGTPGPSFGDSIIADPPKGATDFSNPYVPYDKYAGGAPPTEESGFARNRIDISSLVAMATDKTKLYVAWQVYSRDLEYWAIDNIRITGDVMPLSALTGAVPEPSSLLLALVGLPVFGAFRRRRPIG